MLGIVTIICASLLLTCCGDAFRVCSKIESRYRELKHNGCFNTPSFKRTQNEVDNMLRFTDIMKNSKAQENQEEEIVTEDEKIAIESFIDARDTLKQELNIGPNTDISDDYEIIKEMVSEEYNVIEQAKIMKKLGKRIL